MIAGGSLHPFASTESQLIAGRPFCRDVRDAVSCGGQGAYAEYRGDVRLKLNVAAIAIAQAEYEYAAATEEELSIAEEQLLYVLEDDDAE